MSKQRYINTRFWDDGYIATLDPIEKLLFIYFLTNPLTEISGAYEIPLRRIAFDTGIDRDMVLKIVGRFADEDKIIYRDGWVLICNFIRHQSKSEKIQVGIENSLSGCPDWIKDRLSIQYRTLSHLNSFNSNLINSIETAPPVDVTAPPLLEIHLGQILSGVMSELGLKTERGIGSRKEWIEAGTIAFENSFTAEQFLTCFSLLRKQTWRNSAVKPKHVIENLPNIEKIRSEVNGTNKNGGRQDPAPLPNINDINAERSNRPLPATPPSKAIVPRVPGQGPNNPIVIDGSGQAH